MTQLFIGCTDAVLGFVVIHAPESEVECVSTDIDERTAALLVFIEEHAPCGNGTSSESDRFCVINIAESAFIAFALDIERIGALSVLITDGELFAGTLCGVNHLLCFFCVAYPLRVRQRL